MSAKRAQMQGDGRASKVAASPRCLFSRARARSMASDVTKLNDRLVGDRRKI